MKVHDSPAARTPHKRIQSIDILRGVVIVLMVLDHVRDFTHVSGYAFDPLDPDKTTPLLYVIRWVTHLCAPTFVFLAGVSTWLQIAGGRTVRQVSLLLLTRGVWLILLELTVIGYAWSFSIPYMFFLQVIWAIGGSMIALAGLLWLPRTVVLGCGIVIIVGHNLLDGIAVAGPGAGAVVWTLLHVGGLVTIDGLSVLDAYPVLPWAGVMLLGYGIGPLFLTKPAARDRGFIALGASMIAVFLVLRFFNIYGDPIPWLPNIDLRKSVMSFLAVQKYPPSLLYVCATLGPVFAVIPLIERWRGWSSRIFLTYGSVPFFAYILHIFIAHGVAIIVHAACGRDTSQMFDLMRNLVFDQAKMNGTGLALPFTFLTWFLVLAILYPLCRWFSGVRRRRSDWWLAYL
jgi:uncharacterized membrane protein